MSRDLVFEIGTEEIPSTPLYAAIEQLSGDAERVLEAARLAYGEVQVFGSPRRITLIVKGLAEQQADRTVRSRGPALRAAFDADGRPTKAAEGFARGKGVPVDSLEQVEDESGSYVYAVVEERGGLAAEVLPEALASLAENIDWPKSMRWGSGDARFSRPVRWLFALFGDEVIPVSFAGIVATRTTYGHRFLAAGPIEVPEADAYEAMLREGFVEPRQTRRAQLIETGIHSAMQQNDTAAVVPEKTFAEVVNLVEWPSVGVGSFDEEFLSVPREVLENAMEGHQRYFPVQNASGELVNRFIAVHNGDPARGDAIVRGHERVIRARLADAAFFYREDLAVPLESFVDQLESIVFQEKLGTLGAKVSRVESLAERLGDLASAPSDEQAYAVRAAHLSKADLVSSVVVEFPALQGTMGGYYAEAAGEDPHVVRAIVDHYRPRFAGDDPPSTLAGRLVAMADKFDSICGIFAAELAPTGSADPYGLRRAAIGVLQMMLDGTPLPLDAAIEAALAGYSEAIPDLETEKIGAEVHEFILGRLEVLMRERGLAYDTVAAVLAVAVSDPADALSRGEALQAARDLDPETFEDLSVAFTRAKNLADASLGIGTDREIMGPEERALLDALEHGEAKVSELMSGLAYRLVLEEYATLRPPIDTFFDDVLVMDPDEALRANRLKLLNRFVALFEQFADLSRIAG